MHAGESCGVGLHKGEANQLSTFASARVELRLRFFLGEVRPENLERLLAQCVG